MTSTLVDEYPSLFHQLLFFPVEVSVIVVTYLALIRLIVVSFFVIFDRVFPVWYPGLDQNTPWHRYMLRRRPEHSPQDHRCNRCRKRYNRQWACIRVYPFQLRHFLHQPPDIVPEDNRPEADMPLFLSAFCLAAGVERWCHRRAQYLATSPIAAVNNAYCFCVRRQHDMPVFHAYAGTFGEARDRPHSIRFDTDSYRIGIDTFAYGCMYPNRDHFITYKASEGQE